MSADAGTGSVKRFDVVSLDLKKGLAILSATRRPLGTISCPLRETSTLHNMLDFHPLTWALRCYHDPKMGREAIQPAAQHRMSIGNLW